MIIFFTINKHVLSQPSQVILAPRDNTKNNSNNNCGSDIDVSEEVYSFID